MKKVTVLMSTYNGEDYIREQMESIFNQTYENVGIFVRDDGSTDGTVQILKEYEAQGKITLTVGENMGYKRSFHRLLEETKPSDYYSFADQDDIWYADKIERAVAGLETLEQDRPALYFCDFEYYHRGENGEDVYSRRKHQKRKLHFLLMMCSFINFGFATVINEKLRQLFIQIPQDAQFPHDYLSGMIASAFGGIYYEDYSCAAYRRHGDNVSKSNLNFIEFNLWRIKTILFGNDFNFNAKWQAFYEAYAHLFDDAGKRRFFRFASGKCRPDYALYKAFYPKRYRESLIDELVLRLFFLAGRF